MKTTGRIALALSVLGVSGCANLPNSLWPGDVLHEVKLYRLWRMNYQAPPSQNPYFSIPDPLPLDRAFPPGQSGEPINSPAP